MKALCSGSARTTSRVVTPNRRLGSYTPSFFSVSAAMATVELTGLEMMFSSACGQWHTGTFRELPDATGHGAISIAHMYT